MRKWHHPAATMPHTTMRMNRKSPPRRAGESSRLAIATAPITSVDDMSKMNCVSFANPSNVDARYGSSKKTNLSSEPFQPQLPTRELLVRHVVPNDLQITAWRLEYRASGIVNSALLKRVWVG